MKITAQKLAPLLNYIVGRYLEADPSWLSASLRPMVGKSVGVSFTVPKLELLLLIETDTIRICTPREEQANAWIRGSLFDLLRLGMGTGNGDRSAVHLEIVGDVQLVQQLQRLFCEIEFDWEELLAPVLGDIATQQVSRAVRTAQSCANRCIDSLSFSSGEFLQEELKITPTHREIAYFIDRVEKLRDAVERLDARLRRIENK